MLTLAALWALLVRLTIDAEAHFGCKQVNTVLLVFIQL